MIISAQCSPDIQENTRVWVDKSGCKYFINEAIKIQTLNRRLIENKKS
jgi:hypothetical protein